MITLRILLAEDEKDLREAMLVILRQHNFSVDGVENGQEALDYLTYGNNYDCLILDLMMPVLDGLCTIKILRENQNNIPILVLSALGEVEDRVKGLDLGADDYLVKPFDTFELLARIRALTRRPITDGSAVLSFGNVSLNRTQFTATTPHDSIILPNKEFQILELLLLNEPAIITFETLFGRVWGLDADVDQNTVWVTLSNLRKKLKEIKANFVIKSIRNIGYTVELI